MPFVPGIKRLSRLVIDTSKDWASWRILNLGVPTTEGDALRKGTRLSMGEMPDGPDGQVLTGRGAGVDSAFAPSAQFRLVTVHLGTLSPGHNVWADLNLSTVVGARSTPVMLRFEWASGTSTRLRLRENGVVSDVPATDRPMALSMGGIGTRGMHFVTIMRTDAHGIIEWIDQWATTYDVWILGYWET